ncbi:MAG: GNAT family N-acetyltransferase [Elainellaceae cyanobacterium]
MKFLLDTNIVIPVEPTSVDGFEANTETIATLIKLFQEGGHQYFVHPASVNELRRDPDIIRKDARIRLLGKYPTLTISMDIDPRVLTAYKDLENNTHNITDQILLSALVFDAVDYLVTDDLGIHKKANQLGLSSRVATSEEALSIIKALFPKAERERPALNKVFAYELDERDPIFQSFRTDYPEFDSWLRKCKREHRTVWTITSVNKRLRGICIVKNEKNCDYDIDFPTLKICSFKVDESSRGLRYGELLLKGIFDYVDGKPIKSIYIETFDKQAALINLFSNFGFQILKDTSRKGELVLHKSLIFSDDILKNIDPLEFNIKYGPHQAKCDGVGIFIIPIIPKYHRMLFPEFEEQIEIFSGQYSFGNGIRKAYLCRANIRTMQLGDIAVFYRSQDTQGITAYGVVEDLTISQAPDVIARAVGKRTVYTFDEIQELCSSEVLAISFRLCSIFDKPIEREELISNRVLKAPPQSIVSVREEGLEWIKQALAK